MSTPTIVTTNSIVLVNTATITIDVTKINHPPTRGKKPHHHHQPLSVSCHHHANHYRSTITSSISTIMNNVDTFVRMH